MTCLDGHMQYTTIIHCCQRLYKMCGLWVAQCQWNNVMKSMWCGVLFCKQNNFLVGAMTPSSGACGHENMGSKGGGGGGNGGGELREQVGLNTSGKGRTLFRQLHHGTYVRLVELTEQWANQQQA